LVDPDGRFPWPSKGVGILSLKGNIGLGINYGAGASVQRGMAIDKHGMTHFTGYSTFHPGNQNLNEGSTNPIFVEGGGGGIGGEFSWNFSANSFLEAMSEFSVSGTASAKFGVGGSVGLGENSFSVGAAIGFEISIKGGENFKFTESISLSKSESEKAGKFNQWSTSMPILQYDKEGNPYFKSTVKSRGFFGEKNTGISVTSSAIKNDKGYYVPSGIWISKEYKQSLESDKSN
jgi:hypothetical protein